LGAANQILPLSQMPHAILAAINAKPKK